VAAVVAGCARMGSPDGGWYDDTPPHVVGSSPADKGTDVRAKKVTIMFDEFIKLSDAQSKVVISPPQLEQPEIKATGKRIVVELKDSLKPNTTYTIDFSDAISDNNEGNEMGNYTYSFSTGEQIDTFEVSGTVLNAEDLEPVKGILVGLYANTSDTAFTTLPMERVSRTDGSGRFVVKGVAPGKYRAYALQDADGNYIFNQKSEVIAFSHELYEPSAKPDVRQDTVWRDTLHIDRIEVKPYTHFYPDDITLLCFQETQTDRQFIKAERKEPEKFTLYFSYGNDELPKIDGLNFNVGEETFLLEPSEKKDTLVYWLRDTTLVNQDTLSIGLTYLMTDTTGQLVSRTDTMDILSKVPLAKRLKKKAEEEEKWQKEQEKRKKKGQPYDSIMPPKSLEFSVKSKSDIAPDQNVLIEMPTPLAHCDTSAIHLYTKVDSLWYRAQHIFRPRAGTTRQYELLAEWKPGSEYSLEADSAAFTDIFGLTSKAFKQGIKVKADDAFSSLFVRISGISEKGDVRAQLLGSNGKPVKEVVAKGGRLEFYYVTPGTYYLRCYVDANGNGKWDTGLYAEDRQPESVYYFHEEIECKEKWDVKRDWNVGERPRTRQKPSAITKQKGEAAKKLRNRNAERAKELGIPEPGK